MDNITIFIPSKIAFDYLVQRYHKLFKWARMKASPEKNRTLLLVKGSVWEIHFKMILKERIRQRRALDLFTPVQWLLDIEVQRYNNNHKRTSIMQQNLSAQEMKACWYQHSLIPSLLWSVVMYDIAQSRIVCIEQLVNKYLCKWLVVPSCFS